MRRGGRNICVCICVCVLVRTYLLLWAIGKRRKTIIQYKKMFYK